MKWSSMLAQLREHLTVIKLSSNIKKALFLHNNQSWEKKSGKTDFDVPMGSNDGVEVCEMAGIINFKQLSNIMDKNIFGL